MLHDFQLAVVVNRRREFNLMRIPLHQILQRELSQDWSIYYQNFTNEVEEIPFNSGYNPESNQRFFLVDYILPEWLSEQDSGTVRNLDSIGNFEEHFDSIAGIVGFARDDSEEDLVLFQNFTRSRVIRPERAILKRDDVYEKARNPGLMLETKINAAYRVSERRLIFDNFRNVNSYLQLDDLFKEASKEEIMEILEHENLDPEDSEKVAINADQWTRKRFSMLADSNVLDEYTPIDIQRVAQDISFEIRVHNDRIIFPSEKREMKKLLKFLNEELFQGMITRTVYETNSKRQAD